MAEYGVKTSRLKFVAKIPITYSERTLCPVAVAHIGDRCVESHNSQEIRNSKEVLRLMAALCRSPAIRLQLESQKNRDYPVTLDETKEHKLRLDLSTAPDLVACIESGEHFQLVGQAQGALIRTPFLQANTLGESRFEVELPESLTTIRRRDTFRAPMYHDMLANVELVTQDGQHIIGQLENLSIGGCLVKLPLVAAAQLADTHDPAHMTIGFPNGEKLHAAALVRHANKDSAWKNTEAGCEFINYNSEFGKRAAYFVREIERHAARRADRYGEWLTPSDLFTGEPPEREEISQSPEDTLAAIGSFLAAQILELENGEAIAVDKLLIYSHAIVNQLRRDREALFFATARLIDQPPIVRHSIAVAVRLADMVSSDYAKSELRPIIACALIHDLGKKLLPVGLLDMRSSLDDKERAIMHKHVSKIIERIPGTNTLPSAAISSVITMANERLDGSGYPHQRTDGDTPQLARTMAIVNEADALRQPRPDRAPWPQDKVYRHLLSNSAQFDNRIVQHYIRRFGKTPVGALACYSNGVLGWIQRLDELGAPSQVLLAMRLRTRKKLNEIVRGDDITALGRIEQLVEASDFDL